MIAVVPPAVDVMVVDDDDAMRTVLSVLLRSQGYSVSAHGEGARALAALRGGLRPALILLDLSMPDMDGATFRTAQRLDPRTAGIPVVLLSSEPDLARTAEFLGVAGHLQKPSTVDAVLELVARQLTARDGDPATAPRARVPAATPVRPGWILRLRSWRLLERAATTARRWFGAHPVHHAASP